MKSTVKQIVLFLMILPIKFYRHFISPMIPPSCRYSPTCSSYAIQALKKYGPLKGFVLALKRIISCRPGGGQGYDPVP